MANSSIVSTSTTKTGPTQLPIPLLIHQHQYPTLADRQNPPESSSSSTMRIDITICNSSGILAAQTVGQLLVIPNHEHEHEHPTTGFESPNSQNEQTALSIENPDHDSSILTQRDGATVLRIGGEDEAIDLRLTELNGSSDPKDVAYLLRMYPLFMGLVAGKFILGKHAHFPSTNPFVIFSVVTYLMAILDLLILSCINDGLKILPRQQSSHGLYKISKYIFYILCFLAPLSLLPVLFIPKD